MQALADRLKEQARRLGFDLVGIAPAVDPPGAESLREWLAKGYAGEMEYMSRHEAARQHPQSILPDARSVVMAAMVYRQRRGPESFSGRPGPAPANPVASEAALKKTPDPFSPTGRVSCYAWGADYHEVMWRRLDELLAWVQQEVPECRGRAVVDTAPFLERDFARLAGLGWFGKNTMLIDKRLGSFFFLGALLLNLPLPADAPFAADHCGTCTACLDACPTDAFVGPGQMDARKCISYLTIELRSPIPQELRSPMGDWVFGCDICQDVCPWNRKALTRGRESFSGRPDPPAASSAADQAALKKTPDPLAAPDLLELLRLSPDEFRRRFRGTAITRTKRRGLLRNAAIALGNRGELRAVPALIEALQDEEPLVRGAAAWALGQLHDEASLEALRARRQIERDESVRQEIAAALDAAAALARE